MLAVARQEKRRVLVIALKRPPRELAQVLLETEDGWGWWGLNRGYDRERVYKRGREGKDVFDHIDVLVSGFSTNSPGGVFTREERRGDLWRLRSSAGCVLFGIRHICCFHLVYGRRGVSGDGIQQAFTTDFVKRPGHDFPLIQIINY